MRSSMRRRSASFGLWMTAVGVFIPAAAQACAVCAGSSPADDGYYWSVLFLMAMPFTVGGSIGGWLFYKYGRAPGRRMTVPANPLPELSRLTPEWSVVAPPNNGRQMDNGHTDWEKPLAWIQKESEP